MKFKHKILFNLSKKISPRSHFDLI